jgi:hypothetical protein
MPALIDGAPAGRFVDEDHRGARRHAGDDSEARVDTLVRESLAHERTAVIVTDDAHIARA